LPVNDNLAQVATSTAQALTSICEAMANGSAPARAGLFPDAVLPATDRSSLNAMAFAPREVHRRVRAMARNERNLCRGQ
jgi:hypothetical protein